METPSDLSSLDSKYDDGVYDKVEDDTQYDAAAEPIVKAPKLPLFMFISLITLFVFCFIGLLMSGLHFGHRVPSGDCLGQSWVMFSSILGLLYIVLHLQAARRGEPVIRHQPCSSNPLHSGCVVVARLDAIGWAVALIIVSVAVSRDPVAVSCVDLVACIVVTPTIVFILCVDEKATYPFDLPYITPDFSSSSLVTCRVSDIMANMNEVAVEDSISRRNSNHSTRSAPRANSNTAHAAAIAAANSAGPVRSISGPRPPPKTVKEARPWNFTSFDHRTKDQLAASVNEASQMSASRPWVGGPRALALSERAIQTGVLPPPVCFEPKMPEMPGRESEQENRTPMEKRTPETPGAWKKDWSVLAADTGYTSAGTTPASTPAISTLEPTRAANRRLSPVVEVDDRRLSSANTAAQQRTSPISTVPTRTARSAPQPPTTTTTTTTSPSRPWYATRSQTASTTFTCSSRTSSPQDSGYGSIPKPPAAATEPRRASSPARIRLSRAQEALKVHGSKTTTAVLRRPQRLTGDGRPAVDRSAVPAPLTLSRPRPDMLRMPGSFENEWTAR